MKKLFLLSLLLFIGGCGTLGEEKKSFLSPYKSSYTGETTRDCSDLEPENPYSYGSGHYAGFEWAESKDVSSCGGNSQSFIEGCEEYLIQSEDYVSCLNQ